MTPKKARSSTSWRKQIGGTETTFVTSKKNLPLFTRLYQRVLKVRLMGSAALALTWTAAGRLDAYRENGISLWDIAAGGLILECAGGEFWRKPLQKKYAYEVIASNGRLRKKIQRMI